MPGATWEGHCEDPKGPWTGKCPREAGKHAGGLPGDRLVPGKGHWSQGSMEGTRSGTRRGAFLGLGFCSRERQTRWEQVLELVCPGSESWPSAGVPVPLSPLRQEPGHGAQAHHLQGVLPSPPARAGGSQGQHGLGTKLLELLLPGGGGAVLQKSYHSHLRRGRGDGPASG